MSAYDNSVDAVIYKNEGKHGPLWIRRGGQKTAFCAVWGDPPTWLTFKQAKAVATRGLTVIVAGTLLDRFDQVGRPMSMYYVVRRDGHLVDILDVKTGKVWPFSLYEVEHFLAAKLHSGNCVWRFACQET